MDSHLPTSAELESLWVEKYGRPESKKGLLARRWQHRYFLPADVYEALVVGLVRDGDRWLDVGGGEGIFPHNPASEKKLVARCARVVAVDPSDNIHNNRSAHETVQSLVEDYHPQEPFNLVTMRMVVEHVPDPGSFVNALARLVKPGGVAVIFTVGLWSPVTVISRVMPFRFHHAIKQHFWGSDPEGTFPTHYRMNTRASLRRQFESAGFSEQLFARTDDLSVFAGLKGLNRLDLFTWRAFKALGMPYPERNVLAVYRRNDTGA
ncbi:MAG TPA: class I SAM-dependent methyltransferase [Vicinamibacterales bacterium]|nr:class I SAM-dependent methyltransferase [Vicinamibacterales bacterium]